MCVCVCVSAFVGESRFDFCLCVSVCVAVADSYFFFIPPSFYFLLFSFFSLFFAICSLFLDYLSSSYFLAVWILSPYQVNVQENVHVALVFWLICMRVCCWGQAKEGDQPTLMVVKSKSKKKKKDKKKEKKKDKRKQKDKSKIRDASQPPKKKSKASEPGEDGINPLGGLLNEYCEDED